MATNMLSPAVADPKYRLSEADRQRLRSAQPPRIQHPNGIIPAGLLYPVQKMVPRIAKALKSESGMHIDEFDKIMTLEIEQSKADFMKSTDGKW